MRINTSDKTKCCGCGACAVICPQTCIRLVQDEEAFDYPVIDETRCLQCGRCLEVCGMQNAPQLHEVKQTYAAWHTDHIVRAESTSGGVFSALTDVMLSDQGVVAGASFSKDFQSVEHQLASSWQEAEAFRGSKYVQSHTQACFADIVQELEQGRTILFSGAPCQVASLRRLTKDYDHLMTCDIVCHGVPPPEVFKAYIKEVEKKNGSKVVAYEFRKKTHGWNFPKVAILFKNGVVKSFIPWADPFFCGFSLNVFLRPSCYHCPFAVDQRVGDVTLADCWRVAASHPQYDDNKGTSLVLVNSDKGERLLEHARENGLLYLGTYDMRLACRRNTPLRESAKEPAVRQAFFGIFKNTGSFGEAAKTYMSRKFVTRKRLEQMVKRFCWPVLRRFQ